MAETRRRPRFQAKVVDQLPPIAGKQRVAFQPAAVPPPAGWAEALLPIDG